VKIFIKFINKKLSLSKEICYIPIKTIEYEKAHGWVYGLEIENRGNYVVEGILCG
jgi:intein/homing endonuclease